MYPFYVCFAVSHYNIFSQQRSAYFLEAVRCSCCHPPLSFSFFSFSLPIHYSFFYASPPVLVSLFHYFVSFISFVFLFYFTFFSPFVLLLISSPLATTPLLSYFSLILSFPLHSSVNLFSLPSSSSLIRLSPSPVHLPVSRSSSVFLLPTNNSFLYSPFLPSSLYSSPLFSSLLFSCLLSSSSVSPFLDPLLCSSLSARPLVSPFRPSGQVWP